MKSILTPEFRVSYPAVFNPIIFENGKPVFVTSEDPRYKNAKFSITMLFDKSQDISILKKAIQEAILEKWPNPEKRPKKEYIVIPFRDGDKEMSGIEGYENTIFIKATMPAVTKKQNRQKPDVVSQKLEPILDETDFYAGCYARAKIIAFGYEVGKNIGVTFSLGNIQKIRDGEPFSSRIRGVNDFDPIDNFFDEENKENKENFKSQNDMWN